jgi:predicted amidohydrolase YtcJ
MLLKPLHRGFPLVTVEAIRKEKTMWRVLTALTIAVSALVHAAEKPADLVLRHGVVLTVDAKDRVARALAIREGRIVAVGSDSVVTPLIGPKTRVVDLAGRTATPGLIDTHAHLLGGGADEIYKIDLKRTANMTELLATVKARADAAAPGDWVLGHGWNEGVLAEHLPPTLAELDAVSNGHPILLENITHHYAVVNSAALAMAHIDSTTKDPPAGTIVRDFGGLPTGVLKEAAQTIVIDHIPPTTAEQYKATLHAMISQMHAEGMTGVKDPHDDAREWAAYLDFASTEGLSIHACLLIYAGANLDTAKAALELVQRARREAKALPSGDLGVCGVKILIDGSAMGRTAWRYEDYAIDAQHPAPTGRGYPEVEPDVYRQMVLVGQDQAPSPRLAERPIWSRCLDRSGLRGQMTNLYPLSIEFAQPVLFRPLLVGSPPDRERALVPRPSSKQRKGRPNPPVKEGVAR